MIRCLVSNKFQVSLGEAVGYRDKRVLPLKKYKMSAKFHSCAALADQAVSIDVPVVRSVMHSPEIPQPMPHFTQTCSGDGVESWGCQGGERTQIQHQGFRKH